jgi:hypothetical protein
MDKNKKKSKSEKNCFGTKEWSENSGICNRCKSKEACGKMNAENNGSA